MTIQELLCNMEKEFKQLTDKVDKIYLAIIGNNEIGVEGLADKVKNHQLYIEQDKKMKWTIAGIITAASSFISWLIGD